MLSDERGWPDDRGRHGATGYACTLQDDAAEAGLVHPDKEATLLQVRVLQLLHRMHESSGGHTGALAEVLHVSSGQLGGPCRDAGVHQVPGEEAARCGFQGRVLCPSGVSHGYTEVCPVIVVPDTHDAPRLLPTAGKDSPRGTGGGVVAFRSGRTAGDGLLEEQVAKGPHECLHLGHLDVGTVASPLPANDGREGSKRADPTGQVVRVDCVAAGRALAVVEGPEPAQTTDGLDGRPIAGPASKGSTRAHQLAAHHDQAGIQCMQGLPAEAQVLHRAGGVVLDDHVGPAHKMLEHLGGPVVLQVQPEATLGAAG